MGYVDYNEATQYVLQRFGICTGMTFRRVLIILLAICYLFNIFSWVYINTNTFAVVANALFLESILIGSIGVVMFNSIALFAFALYSSVIVFCSILSVVLLGTNHLNAHTIGSSLQKENLMVLLSIFAAIQMINAVVLGQVLRLIKVYANSGSIYMNYVDDDFDF